MQRKSEVRPRICTQEAYLQWIAWLVYDEGRMRRRSWERLFRLLYETEFTYIIDMDENRALDGFELRHRFSEERGCQPPDSPCSVLEMMAALAKRCEDHIMDDPEIGNRTGKWFFVMVDSLGLGDMDDAHFDEARAQYILARFLRRDYAPDGRGGLFVLPNSPSDLRRVDIWYQMMWYLSSLTEGERKRHEGHL